MSEGTFAGTRGNDDNAPIPAIRRTNGNDGAGRLRSFARR